MPQTMLGDRPDQVRHEAQPERRGFYIFSIASGATTSWCTRDARDLRGPSGTAGRAARRLDVSISTPVGGLITFFFNEVVNGLTLGSVYALIALGYSMVYGILKLLNFAHGEVYMFGAFAGFGVLDLLGGPRQPRRPGGRRC